MDRHICAGVLALVGLLFAGLWIPRMQMLHDLHEPGCALIADDEPDIVGVGHLVAYLPTPGPGTPTPEGDRTPVWPVAADGADCRVCPSGECGDRPPAGAVYATLNGVGVATDDEGILTDAPAREGEWRWRQALEMPAGLNRVWGGLRVIYGICIVAFGFGVVGRIISASYEHLQGAVTAARFGSGRERELYQRIIDLCDELGEWELNAHFSRREGRIDELSELVMKMQMMKTGTELNHRVEKGETRTAIAMLMSYDESQRAKLIDEIIKTANEEIQQLYKEIDVARKQGCYEDYSKIGDLFAADTEYTVGQRQMMVPFFFRLMTAVCRATEDNTKRGHEEAALARLIQHANWDDIEAQRRAQPRNRRRSGGGGGSDESEF